MVTSTLRLEISYVSKISRPMYKRKSKILQSTKCSVLRSKHDTKSTKFRAHVTLKKFPMNHSPNRSVNRKHE